jgi:hemoglobin/transferrin/lactoferrin receptor protein
VEADARVLTYAKVWWYGNLTYTYGQNESRNEPVGGIPPFFGLTGLQWKHMALDVDGFFRFASDQNRLSAADKADSRIPPGGSPAWYTFNLRGGYLVFKGIHFHAGIENIMDSNYREHGSGINAPGRNFIAALEWTR